jgi:predicted amidohydrolase YtcJ
VIQSLALFAAMGCAPPPGAPYPSQEPEEGTGEPAAAADLILHDAEIWTVNHAMKRARALAVRDGRLVAVGDDAEVLGLRGDDTEVLDLDGAFVVPGLSDSHVHFAAAAAALEFDLMKTFSQDEFVERTEDVVSRLAPGEWIVGGLWGAHDAWTENSTGRRASEPFTPDIGLVEDATKDHPMFIRKFDGSEFAANRAALVAVGLDPDRPRARDVVFVRGRDRKPTGIMRGDGVPALFDDVMPKEFSHERRVQQTLRALEEIRRHGVTNVSDMSDDEQLAIYRELHAAGELTVRVHFRYDLERWEELAAKGQKIGCGDAWIRLGSLEAHVDGIMGTSGARFLEPYSNDPGDRGRWRRLLVDEDGEFDRRELLDHMVGADAAGFQLSVHAIGDEANRLLFDCLDELVARNGPKDRRFRLVHAQVLHPDDLPRLGKHGVVAEVQPFHLSDDMHWMEERIGRERCKGAYAFRTIVQSGAVLSLGSDWPVTSAAEHAINPMLALYAAVTRQTLGGEPEGGWFPDERITIEEAIRGHTLGPAYGNFEDDIKGSIEVGKLADITVLDRNLLEIEPREIPEAEVLYTIVDGKIVYARD